MTYAINLILGFGVATLGFQISLLLDNKFQPISWQRCTFLLALILVVASIAFGLWLVINRLKDFRATARTARLREESGPDGDIQGLRNLTEKLGRFSWCLFWWQIGTFFAGIFLTMVSVLVSFIDKLVT
jgi:hypothetical protein